MPLKTLRQLAVATLLCVGPLSAQMSGTYTIDPLGTGSRNFKSFAAALQQLHSVGISAAVQFDVASGTYTESLTSTFIKGASTTNRITFRSKVKNAAAIDVSKALFIRATSGVGGVSIGLVFDGFLFFSTNKSSSSPAGALAGDDHEFRNCTFRQCYLSCGGRRIDIHHNFFDGRGYSESLTGVQFRSAVGGSFHSNLVRMDDVETAFQITAFLGSQTPTRIYNNVIWGTVSSSSSKGAVELGGNVEFTHNTVVVRSGKPFNVCRVLTVDTSKLPGSVVRNNILVNLNQGYMAWVSGSNLSSYQVDSNLYFAPGSTPEFHSKDANKSLSFAEWQKATGFDAAGAVADPAFKVNTSAALDVHLQDASPAIRMATKTPTYVAVDQEGTSRFDPASVGAYEGTPRVVFSTWGSGCRGSLGNTPKIGQTGSLSLGSRDFAVTLSRALGGSQVTAALALGTSNTNWGAVKLPFDFGGGCSLLVEPLVVVFVAVSGSGPGNGTASVRLPIPKKPKFKGVAIHLQWGVGDPAAKGIGIAFSDAATVSL